MFRRARQHIKTGLQFSGAASPHLSSVASITSSSPPVPGFLLCSAGSLTARRQIAVSQRRFITFSGSSSNENDTKEATPQEKKGEEEEEARLPAPEDFGIDESASTKGSASSTSVVPSTTTTAPTAAKSEEQTATTSDVSSDADIATGSDSDSSGSKQVAKVNWDEYKHLFNVGPQRPDGLFTVEELHDEDAKTVSFAKIDEVESDIKEYLRQDQEALLVHEDQEDWKHKLMFEQGFWRTPKHLSWVEFGKELECMDITIEIDKHRPEEVYLLNFFFRDKERGVRDLIWTCRNDVARSEGLTDLLAAIGCGLSRNDMHRTVRFDDGLGTCREINIRKNSRYTSEVRLAFRTVENYNMYEQAKYEMDQEKRETDEDISLWGFHPSLLEHEYRDSADPPGTYHICVSSHALAFMMLQALERLIQKPLKEFYRPSQLAKRASPDTTDDTGVFHAVAGWLGAEETLFPHFTPLEAVQDHWLGNDAPFTITALMNKLREMCNMNKKNPELQSWMSVRKRDTMTAIRNIKAKQLGAGASTLFKPIGHSSTVNMLLPKDQRRKLRSRVSVAGVLSMPDETRRLDEYKALTKGEGKLDDNRQSSTAAPQQPGNEEEASGGTKKEKEGRKGEK